MKDPPRVLLPVGGVVQKLRSFEANQRMPLTLTFPCTHAIPLAFTAKCCRNPSDPGHTVLGTRSDITTSVSSIVASARRGRKINR